MPRVPCENDDLTCELCRPLPVELEATTIDRPAYWTAGRSRHSHFWRWCRVRRPQSFWSTGFGALVAAAPPSLAGRPPPRRLRFLSSRDRGAIGALDQERSNRRCPGLGRRPAVGQRRDRSDRRRLVEEASSGGSRRRPGRPAATRSAASRIFSANAVSSGATPPVPAAGCLTSRCTVPAVARNPSTSNSSPGAGQHGHHVGVPEAGVGSGLARS